MKTSELTIISFPVTRGAKRGQLLELARLPEGIRARFEGAAVWCTVSTQAMDDGSIVLCVHNGSRSHEVPMSGVAFYDLVKRVKSC